MKRGLWLAASVGMVAWGLTGALGACGGSSDEALDAGDESSSGASSGATSSGATSSGSTSSGSTSSGGDPDASDGSSTSSSSSGGSTPGQVTCGGQTCTSPTSCCERADGGGFCGDGGINGGCGASVRFRCDEPADCDGGRSCCLGFGGSSCSNGCNAYEIHLCKTNAQCPDGGTCKQVTCSFFDGGATYVVDSCDTTNACK